MNAQGPARVNFEAPYRTAEHSVSAAYALESRAIVEISTYFRDLRGGTVPLPGREPMSAHDRHAQAAMTLSFIAGVLDPVEQLVVRAKHTRPDTPELTRRKENDIVLVHELLVFGWGPRGAPHGFRDYAIDAIRGWARARRVHKELWWADHFEVDVGRLRRWRWGSRRRRARGFLSRIEGTYQDAIGKLADPMYDAGLTQE